MVASANWYANVLPQAFLKNINLTSDSLKMLLLDSGYTPNLLTNVHYSDISSHELAASGGYSTGGAALSSPSFTLTAANSWSVNWSASTAYAYGQVVRPAIGNGFLYRCVVAGTSAGSAPTFPTVTGTTVADGGVTWACLGDAICVFSSSLVSWSAATFTANFAVIYDSSPGSAATDPLIALQTFATAQSPAGVTFIVSPDPALGWGYFSPPS